MIFSVYKTSLWIYLHYFFSCFFTKMSFLTFLCIASVFYLCAADPIDSPAALSDQERVNKFMTAVEKAYDEDIAPLWTALSEDDRDYMKITSMDGVGSFINYCIMRSKDVNDADSISKVMDDGYVVMQLDSPDSFEPAVPYKQPPVASQAA